MIQILDILLSNWQWYRRLRKGYWRKYRVQYNRHFNEIGFEDHDEWERLSVKNTEIVEFYGQMKEKVFIKDEDYN